LHEFPPRRYSFPKRRSSDLRIIGGILILEAANEIALFQRKTTAKNIDKKDCNPHNGAMPIKTPKATDKAFISLLSSAWSTSSFTNRLKLFFLKDRKKSLGLIYSNAIVTNIVLRILMRVKSRNGLKCETRS